MTFYEPLCHNDLPPPDRNDSRRGNATGEDAPLVSVALRLVPTVKEVKESICRMKTMGGLGGVESINQSLLSWSAVDHELILTLQVINNPLAQV